MALLPSCVRCRAQSTNYILEVEYDLLDWLATKLDEIKLVNLVELWNICPWEVHLSVLGRNPVFEYTDSIPEYGDQSELSSQVQLLPDAFYSIMCVPLNRL